MCTWTNNFINFELFLESHSYVLQLNVNDQKTLEFPCLSCCWGVRNIMNKIQEQTKGVTQSTCWSWRCSIIINIYIAMPSMKSHRVILLLLQCSIPEPLTTGLGPASLLPSEPQPERQQWHYFHFVWTIKSTFLKPCRLGCASAHCFVSQPNTHSQGPSTSQDVASDLEFSLTILAIVVQMPCLLKELCIVWYSAVSNFKIHTVAN